MVHRSLAGLICTATVVSTLLATPRASAQVAADSVRSNPVSILSLHLTTFEVLDGLGDDRLIGFGGAFLTNLTPSGRLIMNVTGNFYSSNGVSGSAGHLALGYAFLQRDAGRVQNGAAFTLGLWLPESGEVFPTIGLSGYRSVSFLGKVLYVPGLDVILPKDGGDWGLAIRFGLGYQIR